MQPLTGDTIYEDFLDRHGEGVHHVAVDCNGIPFDERIRRFADHGNPVIQSGVWLGRVPYAYFATEEDTGTILETFVIPADLAFPEPDEWYPAAPA